MKTKIITIIIGLAFAFTAAFTFNHFYHEDVRDSPTRYCYDTIKGVINPAMILPSDLYEDSYLSFFENQNRNLGEVIPFPIKNLDIGQKVYLLEVDSVNSLARIAIYQEPRRYIRNSFSTGWVHISLLHTTAPAIRGE